MDRYMVLIASEECDFGIRDHGMLAFEGIDAVYIGNRMQALDFANEHPETAIVISFNGPGSSFSSFSETIKPHEKPQ